MGRSEKFFDNPMQYRPERWLDGDEKTPEGTSVKEILNPFGLGPRNCIGKQWVLVPGPKDVVPTVRLTLTCLTEWR
jgi:cytochrome P450